MNLESVRLDKFHDKALKKEQMFKLNGGGAATLGDVMSNGTHNSFLECFN